MTPWTSLGPWRRPGMALALVALVAPGPVRAQVDDWPLRLRLFRAAKTARDQGKVDQAHRLYARAARLPPGTDPTQARVLERLNHHRMHAMVVPVMPHPKVQRAAEGHARYLRANTSTKALSLAQAHRQTPGRAGFTGERLGDRLLEVGLAGGSTEGVTSEVEPEAAVDILVNSVYHRTGMLRQEARYAGFGATTQAVIDLFWEAGAGDETELVYYPGPDQEDVPPRFPGGETPDPMPGREYPVGPPLCVAGSGGTPDLLEASLTGPRGEVPLIPLRDPPRPDLLGDYAFWMPAEPLEPGTRYRVQARVRLPGGAARALDWRFTTGRNVAGEQWVRLSNLVLPRQDVRAGKPLRFVLSTEASHPEALVIRWLVDGEVVQDGPAHELTWPAVAGDHLVSIRAYYPGWSEAFVEKTFQVQVPGAGEEPGAAPGAGEFTVAPLPPWRPGTRVTFSTRPLPEAATYTFSVNGETIGSGPQAERVWEADGRAVRELRVDAQSARRSFSRMLYARD